MKKEQKGRGKRWERKELRIKGKSGLHEHEHFECERQGGHIKNVMTKFKISEKILKKIIYCVLKSDIKVLEYAIKYKGFYLKN